MRKNNFRGNFFPTPVGPPYFRKLWVNRWSKSKSEAALQVGNFMEIILFFITFSRQTHRLAAIYDYV